MQPYRLPAYVAERIASARDMEEVQSVVSGFTSDVGFKKLTYHLVRVNGYGDPLRAFISDYPEEWLHRYVKSNYVKHDLVHMRGRNTVLPFSWSGLQRGPISEGAARVFGEARDFGLLEGLSVPVHGPNSFAMFSLVADGTRAEQAESVRRSMDAMALLGLHIHERARSLLEDRVREVTDTHPVLTPRERECLQWLGAGKRSPDVALILGIAEGTVNSHVRMAMDKLNASTRTHATVKALHLGLIEHA